MFSWSFLAYFQLNEMKCLMINFWLSFRSDYLCSERFEGEKANAGMKCSVLCPYVTERGNIFNTVKLKLFAENHLKLFIYIQNSYVTVKN